MQPQVFIKYGQKEHLEQLVSGSIRFAPTEDYISTEKSTGVKGQGDSDEGKLHIKSTRTVLQPHDGASSATIIPDLRACLSFEDVNRLPVFCLSQYSEEDMVNEQILKLPKEKVDVIKHDFPKATHALIIQEPETFISDVKKVSEDVDSNEIKYFDYNYLWLDMLSFITSTSKDSKCFSLTTENIYRQLYCKNDTLKAQQEYRFILLDRYIDKAIFLPFKFSSKYKIVPIDDLYKEIEL